MSRKTAQRTRQFWPCTVDGCNKDPDDHTELTADEVVHHRDPLEYPGPSDVVWPLDLKIVTYDTIAPHWRMMVDVYSTAEDLTAEIVQYMALELSMNAAYVAHLNAEIDAAKGQGA